MTHLGPHSDSRDMSNHQLNVLSHGLFVKNDHDQAWQIGEKKVQIQMFKLWVLPYFVLGSMI